jgi:Cysteine rich repeat
MKASKMVLIVALLFWLVPLIAQAQEINRKESCKADIEKICKDIKPGQGRIEKCLQRHEGELSPACRNLIAEERACEADVAKFCKGVKPGEGRIINCLKQHQTELSAGCGAYLHNK